jgi:hypothetical protein
MPIPVSLTATVTTPPAPGTVTPTRPPSRVNFTGHSQDLGHGGLLLERIAERAPQSLELGLQVCMG